MEDLWKSHKAEHLKLSAIAAAKYDEIYEKSNFATGSYMKYEIEILKKFTAEINPKNIALDLGCGTGRGSFYLSKQFEQVYGYDFSPEMISNANSIKIQKKIGNVYFGKLDIEEQELPWRDNSIQFVNTAFGMGSFILNVEQLFREIKRVLEPTGICIFSFYNSEALVNGLVLNWKPALAARVVNGENCLEVQFEESIYKIAAKAYTVNEIKRKIINTFGNNNLIEITTFPTLTALFPQNLFTDDRTRELCTRVDNLLANNLDIAAGPYIVAVCKKGGHKEPVQNLKGYAHVLNLLHIHDIDIKKRIKQHDAVKTMEDVKKVLSVSPSCMIKSILVTIKNAENQNYISNLYRSLYLIGIPADRRLDFGSLSTILKIPRKSLEMASQEQVEEITGFQVGSIPPFGLPRNIPVIIDISFSDKTEIWCGTGKSTESIKLTLPELKVLSTPSFNHVSKPKD